MTRDTAKGTVIGRRRILPPIALLALAACGDPDVFLPGEGFGAPAGVLAGTVAYSGPRPCTEGGHIVGAAVLLAFDVNALPPPEGLGTSAASLDVISGDTFFGDVRAQLSFDPQGARLCPDSSAPPITVSGDWTLAPLRAGIYEVRGFYDLDGSFDPSFSIANLPNKGDIGGGAIENSAAVLQSGAAPLYRRIALGQNGAIPSTGARVGGIDVEIGQPLPLDRPVFYAKSVIDETSAGNIDPTHVVMPADFQLKSFTMSPSTETSFIRYDFGAGVAPSEVAVAAGAPFNIQAPPGFDFTRQDINGDGVLDASDHVPDSTLLPSLFPLALFTKLEDGAPLVRQSPRAVVLQGITFYKSLLGTAASPAALNDTLPDVIVALRPAVLCIDTSSPSAHGVLLSAHETDSLDNEILTDPAGVATALQAQFGRPIDIRYGCLPQGEYAANLVYGTGQAWTVPNEAGVCQSGEVESANGQRCGSRARLTSQGITLTIGAPADPAYCAAQGPTPAVCLP